MVMQLYLKLARTSSYLSVGGRGILYLVNFQYLIQCRGENGMLHHGCASYYTSRVEQ